MKEQIFRRKAILFSILLAVLFLLLEFVFKNYYCPLEFKDNQYTNNAFDENGIRTINPKGFSFGPYWSIPSGSYKLEIIGKNLEQCFFHIYSGCGRSNHPFDKKLTNNKAVLTFLLKEDISNIEFYVRNEGDSNVQLNSMILKNNYFFNFHIIIILSFLVFLIFYKLFQLILPSKKIENISMADCIFIMAFFLLLAFPVSNFDNKEYSLQENRMLSTYKHFILKNCNINWNYGRDFESWFNDHFYLRNYFWYLNNKISLKLFSPKEVSPQLVLVGRESWLYEVEKNRVGIEDFQNIISFNEEELIKIANYLNEINQWCEKHKKKFYLVIPPMKYRIYGEYFPSYIKKINSDEHSRTNKLIDYLRQNTNINVINPYNELMKHKEEGFLYWKKNDSLHWNELGGYYGYLSIMNEIQKDFNIAPLELVEKENYHTVKNRLLEIQTGEGDLEQYSRPIFDKLYQANEPKDSRGIVITQNEKGKNNLFMLRDSFSFELIPYFANTFNNCFFDQLWFQDIDNEDLQKIKKEFDIVILEIIELNLPKLINCIFPMETEAE